MAPHRTDSAWRAKSRQIGPVPSDLDEPLPLPSYAIGQALYAAVVSACIVGVGYAGIIAAIIWITP